jgi:CRP/FNR family transcriptional regulator
MATYRPKTVLFREGNPNPNLYELRSGHVKLTSVMEDGRQQILRIGTPGHLLGFESLEHDTHTYTVTTLDEAEICTIPKKLLQTTFSVTPVVLSRINKKLTEELEMAEEMICLLGMKNSSERVASFLLSLSGKDEDNDDTGNLPLHLSREEIANILGLTTTTVCRVMTDFQRKAIIVAPRGSVRILDRMRLRLMSGDS